MKHYVDLESQKHYEKNVKAESLSIRRQQLYEAVKMFILSSILVFGFTMACLALWASPEVVLNAVDSLKAQGLWPR